MPDVKAVLTSTEHLNARRNSPSPDSMNSVRSMSFGSDLKEITADECSMGHWLHFAYFKLYTSFIPEPQPIPAAMRSFRSAPPLRNRCLLRRQSFRRPSFAVLFHRSFIVILISGQIQRRRSYIIGCLAKDSSSASTEASFTSERMDFGSRSPSSVRSFLVVANIWWQSELS